MTLPRRAFLGIELAAGPFARGGLEVSGVVPSSMAESAGLRKGDLVLAIGGLPVTSEQDLTKTLRAIARRERVTLLVEREQVREEREAPVVPRPREASEEHDVIYDSVSIDGVRQRAILTRPKSAGPHTIVAILQGIGEDSIEALSPELPLARLVHGLARAGFGTLRVERRGLGDSEGDPSSRRPDQEIAAFAHAIERWRKEPWVSNVALFGHSLGGMLAPFLAPEVSAIVVYGTSATRWLDCVEASARRQIELRGLPHTAIDRTPTAYDLALDALDVRAAWRRASCPVLVLHGEHDWVVSADEASEIVSYAQGRARFELVPDADHAFTCHRDRAESLRNLGGGTFASSIVEEAASFVRDACAT